MYCASCGGELNDPRKFCPNCGANLGVSPSPPQEQTRDAVPPPSKPKQSNFGSGRKVLLTISIIAALAALVGFEELSKTDSANVSSPASTSSAKNSSPGINLEILVDLCGPPDTDQRGQSVDHGYEGRILSYHKYGVMLEYAAWLDSTGNYSNDSWHLAGLKSWPSGDKITMDSAQMRMPCLRKFYASK